jgi:hypothetical protein
VWAESASLSGWELVEAESVLELVESVLVSGWVEVE